MLTITELLEEQGIQYRTTEQHRNVRDGWVGVNCPFCGDVGEKFHLGISLDGSRATCWQCGWHPITNVRMELTRLPYGKCRQWAENLYPEQVEDRVKHLRRGNLKLPAGVGGLLNTHKKYLHSRGLDPDEMEEKWDVGGLGPAPRYAWRIFIPIKYWGTTVSWTTRSLSDNGVRYLAAPPDSEAMSPRDFLFGEEHALHTIIVCEGVFDVFKIGYGAVCTMGIGYSQEQFNAMTNFPRRVVCYDADAPGQMRANKLCHDLEAFPGETINVTLSGGDPGDASEIVINRIREEYLR